MKRKPKLNFPARYILMGLTILCLISVYVSLTLNLSGGPLNE